MSEKGDVRIERYAPPQELMEELCNWCAQLSDHIVKTTDVDFTNAARLTAHVLAAYAELIMENEDLGDDKEEVKH
jgi:hypothetical protein